VEYIIWFVCLGLSQFISEYLESVKKSTDKKEIQEFFENLERKKEKSVIGYQTGTILSDTNYDMFYSFINDTKKSLYILMWRIDERLLSEMLWSLKDKDVRVLLITKNRIKKGYIDKFKTYCSKLKIELVHRNKIHAKIIIKDDNMLILGSSNITLASMSESGHLLDCNIITNHKETIQDSITLFQSWYINKDYMKKIENSKLMYSKNSPDCLPFSIKQYFERETEEIVLLWKFLEQRQTFTR